MKTFDLTDEPARRPRPNKPGRPQPRRGRPKNALDGWIVLDKPQGLTSTQALGAVKRVLSPEKAGHAGTLDPLATGCLPLALGEATKTVPYVVDGEKSYRFTLEWGAQTDTDDADGTVIARSHVRPSVEALEAALPAFVGEIMQVPPQYSAVKIGGQRAYDLAREGERVEIKARPVTIRRLALVAVEGDRVTLEADCGKGTYVRAIARDLGARLGTAAHVTALRRTRVGPFREGDMVSLADLSEAAIADTQGAVDTHLRAPAEALAGLARVAVDRTAASRLRRGQSALLRPGDDFGITDTHEGECLAVAGPELLAICRAEIGELHPVRVFRSPRRRVTVTAPRPPEDDATAEPRAPSEAGAS